MNIPTQAPGVRRRIEQRPLPQPRHRRPFQAGHTVIVVSTGERLANTDYVSDCSLFRARAALRFFRTFYGNRYDLGIAEVREGTGELIPLTE